MAVLRALSFFFFFCVNVNDISKTPKRRLQNKLQSGQGELDTQHTS